jgi:hypothetical protein
LERDIAQMFTSMPCLDELEGIFVAGRSCTAIEVETAIRSMMEEGRVDEGCDGGSKWVWNDQKCDPLLPKEWCLLSGTVQDGNRADQRWRFYR